MSYSADVNEHTLYPIPLNGTNVLLGGNALFNSSCGGTIYLPTISDSVTFTFTGTGLEIDYIPLYLSSEASLVVDNSVETAITPDYLGGAGEPLNCSDVRRQWMGIGLDRVLKYGQHSATIKPNYPNLEEVGTGVLVSKINYLNEPEPTTASYGSEATGSVSSGSSSSSGSSHLKVTVGVPVGAIGILILVLAAVYGCWKRRLSRNSNGQSDGVAGKKVSATTSPPADEPSAARAPPASLALDTPTIEKGALTTSPVTTSLPTTPTMLPTEATASPPMTAERVALVQALTRQGLPSNQIAAVLESMSNVAEPPVSAQREPGGLGRMGQTDDPPPVYDFKNRTS